MILSCTQDSKCFKTLQRRKYNVLQVEELFEWERLGLIRQFLSWNSKQLTENHEFTLIQDQKMANPLFCKVFLEDIAVFGEYDELEYRIMTNLKAKNTSELYELMLERMETDYDPALLGIVERFVCLIWSSVR